MSTPENSQGAVGEPAPKNSEKAKMMTRATIRHAVPFFLWIGIMLLAGMMHLSESSATEEIGSLNLISDASLYALRSAVCAIVLILLRPWKFYSRLNTKNILPAVGLGLAVFLLWVGFETQTFKHLMPGIADLYEKWCVMPFGAMREPVEYTPYAPAVCGWGMTAARLAGSAFVIAVIEEFFWRGCLIRCIRTPDFLDIDIGEFHAVSFLAVAAIFGFQHTEWLAGLVTGIAYGYYYIRSRDIWAVSIAHVTTNLALGIYVIATKSWQFW